MNIVKVYRALFQNSPRPDEWALYL